MSLSGKLERVLEKPMCDCISAHPKRHRGETSKSKLVAPKQVLFWPLYADNPRCHMSRETSSWQGKLQLIHTKPTTGDWRRRVTHEGKLEEQDDAVLARVPL